MERKIKSQIIKSAANIKKKVRMLKDIKNSNDAVLETIFKPITGSLNQMKASNNQVSITETTHESPKTYKDENSESDSIDSDNTRNEDSNEDSNEDFVEDKNLSNKTLQSHIVSSPPDSDIAEDHNESSEPSFSSIPSTSSPSKSSLSWSLSSEIIHDVPFGLRWERGKLMMGKMRVYDKDEYINIGGNNYKKTPGLMELLTQNTPDLNIVNENDKQIYKHILTETNAHRRDFNPKKPIKSNKGLKYNHVIKPLFKLVKSDIGTSNESLAQGKGLNILKKVKKNTDYVYWDDPNELIERLKLLIASRDAGNTGLDNEIISIIEELREANIIP